MQHQFSPETAMAAALRRAGGPDANEAQFTVAIAKFQNNGGSYERALALLADAYEKETEGQPARAIQGHTRLADASLESEEGHSGRAAKAIDVLSSSLSHSNGGRNSAGGAGRGSASQTTKTGVPRPVSPSYLVAAKAGAQKMALTVLDSFKVRDGRAIGDLTFGELEAIRATNAQEASVIRQIQRHAGNATGNQLVREVIKAKDLEIMIQRGAEVADAT